MRYRNPQHCKAEIILSTVFAHDHVALMLSRHPTGDCLESNSLALVVSPRRLLNLAETAWPIDIEDSD